MKLSKAIIKKFGITKKAWRIFKSKKPLRSVQKMRKKKRSTYSRVSSGMGGMLPKLIVPATAVLYGITRNKIGQQIQTVNLGPLNALGPYKDEAVVLGATYGAQALGANKNVILRRAINTIQACEWARFGQTYAAVGFNTNGGSDSTQMILY
jgi:hypothetical protein